jgi:PEGA domain
MTALSRLAGALCALTIALGPVSAAAQSRERVRDDRRVVTRRAVVRDGSERRVVRSRVDDRRVVSRAVRRPYSYPSNSYRSYRPGVYRSYGDRSSYYARPYYSRPGYRYYRPGYGYYRPGYGYYGPGYRYYRPGYYRPGLSVGVFLGSPGYYRPYYPGYYAPYPYYGYAPYGYAPSAYGHAPYASEYDDIGGVRLQVSPRDATVHVDGYYAGIVDDFDGVGQRLSLESGTHRIEISKPGFETLGVDVNVRPHETIKYRGHLLPLP